MSINFVYKIIGIYMPVYECIPIYVHHVVVFLPCTLPHKYTNIKIIS